MLAPSAALTELKKKEKEVEEEDSGDEKADLAPVPLMASMHVSFFLTSDQMIINFSMNNSQ